MIHLKIGGSTAARTLACPGWIKKSEGITPRPAGQAAIDGSMHHEVQETCQKAGVLPDECLGMVYEEDGRARTFTEDDLDLSNIAYNATNALLDELDIDELMIEPFVQFIPDVAGGSIDVLGLSADRGTITPPDYKFGAVRVPVENNAQQLFYLMCARKDPLTADMFEKVHTLVLAIVQPKIKGVVATWTTDIATLDAFEVKMVDAIDNSKSENPRVCPGSHCQWCPSAPYCQEKKRAVFAATLLDAKSHNELCAAAAELENVEHWLKATKEELYMQINRGVSVPGWKVVDKRPATKWVDEAAAREFLKKKRIAGRDVVKPATLMTPIQVGNVLHKKGRDLDLTEFVVKTSSGTTLAPDSDSRDAVIATDVPDNLTKLMSGKK